MTRIWLSSVLAGFGFLASATMSGAAADKTIKVAATINPLTIIVNEVASGVLTAETIIPPNQSVHVSQLRPSQRRTISKADVIFAIHPYMEESLAPVMEQEGDKFVLVADLMQDLLKHRDDDDDEGHDDHDDHKGHDDHDDHKGHDDHDDHAHHDDHKGHDDHAGHGHAHEDYEFDLHIWLSTDAMIRFSEIVRDVLSEKMPEHAGLFAANAAKVTADIQAVKKQMRAILPEDRTLKFIGMHDIALYLEQDLAIEAVGFLVDHVETTASAGRLRDLQSIAASTQVDCLFYEPQFSKDMAEQLAKDIGVTAYLIDPLGIGATTTKEFWGLLRDAFAACAS
ncbi:MAG: metal ABC transporter substrate-binding protein [Candidatus Puniceispirillaceae bacterium]